MDDLEPIGMGRHREIRREGSRLARMDTVRTGLIGAKRLQIIARIRLAVLFGGRRTRSRSGVQRRAFQLRARRHGHEAGATHRKPSS